MWSCTLELWEIIVKVQPISHFGSQPAVSDALFPTLFPQTVVLKYRRIPGDPGDLHPVEAEHVAKAVPKRVAEFAAGRACARAALAEFGVRAVTLPAAPDRQPLWPDGFIGSITHTAGFCAAAVARRSNILAIGLDTEIAGAPTEDIWPVISRGEELAWIRSLPGGDRYAAITLLFAAKEAFYKCQYPLVGEWLDFHDLAVQVREWGEPAGSFAVTAARSIAFAGRVALPIVGRYLHHEHFVSAAVAVPVPVG